MEELRAYLERMFAGKPDSENVRRAKEELYSMMEDKYQALRGEGLTEEAAVSRVISEFGSLDEIAADLGIGSEVVYSGGEEPQSSRTKGVVYSDPTIQAIMDVYWETVLCLYLSWSFLTFAWWRTWIVWPVAAIIHALVKRIFKGENVC